MTNYRRSIAGAPRTSLIQLTSVWSTTMPIGVYSPANRSCHPCEQSCEFARDDGDDHQGGNRDESMRPTVRVHSSGCCGRWQCRVSDIEPTQGFECSLARPHAGGCGCLADVRCFLTGNGGGLLEASSLEAFPRMLRKNGKKD